MPTFVHTGDIHLDTPFSAHFNKQQMQIRRREILQTFRSIVLTAKNKDFLFISGDLFDGQFVSTETISFVKRCFSEIPETDVFISAGNHDPLLSRSAYESNDWGANVHIFSTEWEYFDFPEKKTRIHGRSFGSVHAEETLFDSIKVAPDWCNIMVLHGDLVANGGKSSYNPIEKEAIAKSCMDYVALGHIHQRSELARVDGVYYAYCGIPEGRGFDEEGEKGYYIGEVNHGNVELSWMPSSSRRFWHVHCDITEAIDIFSVQEMITNSMKQTGRVEDCYKIILEGTARRGMIDCDFLKTTLKDQGFYLDFVDRTKPEVPLEETARENSLRGNFVAAMMEKIQAMPEEEKEIGYLALELGLSAMEGGQKP